MSASRYLRLFPSGTPRYVRCYDNGGESADRYTVVYSGRYKGRKPGTCQYVGMSDKPFHPQGVGQHGESDSIIDINKAGYAPAIGRRNHLGKRIPYNALPMDCQILVRQDYNKIWSV